MCSRCYVLLSAACRQAKARAAREAAVVATQEAAGRLLGHFHELHERLAQLRVQVRGGGVLLGVCLCASCALLCWYRQHKS